MNGSIGGELIKMVGVNDIKNTEINTMEVVNY